MNIELNVKGRLYNVQMWPIGGYWCHKHFKAQLYSTVFCSSLVCCFLWKDNNKKKGHKLLWLGFQLCSFHRGFTDRFHIQNVLYVAFRGNWKIINNKACLNPINFEIMLKMMLLYVRKEDEILGISKNKLG